MRDARRVREPTQPGIVGSTLTRVAIAPRPRIKSRIKSGAGSLPQAGEVYSPVLFFPAV
jgi:hypothetical protein